MLNKIEPIVILKASNGYIVRNIDKNEAWNIKEWLVFNSLWDLKLFLDDFFESKTLFVNQNKEG